MECRNIRICMKPPLSYYGGKQKLAKAICAALYQSPNWSGKGHYIEPYFGGGAVFFAKEPQRMETINDLNDSLIAFYRVVKDPAGFEKLKALLDGTLYSRSEFNRAGRILKGEESATPEEKAWAVFVGIQQSFACGGLGRGWGRCGKDSFEHLHWCPHTYQNKLGLLDANDYCGRLKNVQAESGDALKLIKGLDAPRAIFYLDPPYAGTHCDYAGLKWRDTGLAALLEALKGLKGRFVLSGFPHPLIDAAQAECGWTQLRKRCAYSMQVKDPAKKQGKIECLTANYPFSLEGWEEHVPESANFAREGGDAHPIRANRVREEAI